MYTDQVCTVQIVSEPQINAFEDHARVKWRSGLDMDDGAGLAVIMQ